VVQPIVRTRGAAVRRAGVVVQGRRAQAADEIIDIDDRPDYVAVATALGMRSFVHDPSLPPPAL